VQAATDTTARSGAATAAPWHARAFGLDLEGDFLAPGLPATTVAAAMPRTRIELVSPAAINELWPATGTERLLEETFDDPTPARTIDRHPDAGYRLFARHFGVALISPDSSRIACAPPPAATAWRWQRFLLGRILPWAALIAGREVLHASAVRIGDGAIAFVGPSGAGKTTLAARLLLRGAGLLTDDVLAVDRGDGAVRAHPGAAIVAVRDPEREALGPTDFGRLGTLVEHSDKSYVWVDREAEALPLRAVYFLEPATGRRDNPAIETLPAVDPRLLLASTFVVSVRSPERLRRLLDVCADLAATARAYRVAVDRSAGPERLAAAVHAHALASLGARP
jgi:hypothetical protein